MHVYEVFCEDVDRWTCGLLLVMVFFCILGTICTDKIMQVMV